MRAASITVLAASVCAALSPLPAGPNRIFHPSRAPSFAPSARTARVLALAREAGDNEAVESWFDRGKRLTPSPPAPPQAEATLTEVAVPEAAPSAATVRLTTKLATAVTATRTNPPTAASVGSASTVGDATSVPQHWFHH